MVGALRHRVRKIGVLGVTALIITSLTWIGVNSAFADISLGGVQNCDANAVLYCGASSVSQVVTKYNDGDGYNSTKSIHDIYEYFGITSADIQVLPSSAVAGTVSKTGDVYVNGQIVATAALTAGRDTIAGSALASDAGTSFYTRPPSVSFENSSLNAYVVMVGGRFSYAILSSCGNPVKATPITPAPTPTPTPSPKPTPTPMPMPSGACTDLGLSQTGDNPRNVTALVAYSVSNGAHLNGVSFNWGDGSTTSPNGQSVSATHVYQQGGNYRVVAMLSFNGKQSVPSVTCDAQISVVTSVPLCSGLSIEVANNTVTITNFTYSANDSGATFDHATLDWGDGSPVVSSADLIGQTHTYTSTGSHTIIATAYFASNNTLNPYTSQDCQQLVSFVQPTTTPTPTPNPSPAPTSPTTTTTSTTPTPASLINTGSGDVAGLFVASTIAGTFIFRRLIGRHFSR